MGGWNMGSWDDGQSTTTASAALFSAARSVCADWTSSQSMEVAVWKSSGGFGPVTKIARLCLYCGRLTESPKILC